MNLFRGNNQSTLNLDKVNLELRMTVVKKNDSGKKKTLTVKLTFSIWLSKSHFLA